ncbi:unnamed protein product [Adineta ricciae]|uniref:ADP-ribosylglycohydrolase n=1 Tax=Adineta ricciae TaxID=249248 RepID=A0A815EKU5_ADIRI|nr:unnamed protein product [Adineta ricciae]CAF1464296.1 unnamed protein product [Adineta ricciae]
MLQFPHPDDKLLPDQIKLVQTPYYHKKDEICKRIVGSLVGLAVGDALGASVEFRPQEYLVTNPVKTMQGGGTWGLDAGKWTDDTSMALCLASSLISENGFNPYNQMVRYKWWHRYGYLSSTGHCFDIGQTTRQALTEFANRQRNLKVAYHCQNDYETDMLALDSVERTFNFNISCSDPDSAGNGALMRLAPIPLFYFQSPLIAIESAGRSAALTHANQKAVDACRYYAALIIAALRGSTKDELLDKNFYINHKDWFGEDKLHDDVQTIIQGSFKKKGGYNEGIRGKGYVINSLEAALWAFWADEDSFEKGALNAVNLGDDTDTTAAIHGQLAGAFYGYDKIPKEWLEKLYAHDFLVTVAEWLHFMGIQRVDESYPVYETEDKQILSETNDCQTDQQHSDLVVSVYSLQVDPIGSVPSNDDVLDHYFQSSLNDEEDTYTRNAYDHGFYRNKP